MNEKAPTEENLNTQNTQNNGSATGEVAEPIVTNEYTAIDKKNRKKFIIITAIIAVIVIAAIVIALALGNTQQSDEPETTQAVAAEQEQVFHFLLESDVKDSEVVLEEATITICSTENSDKVLKTIKDVAMNEHVEVDLSSLADGEYLAIIKDTPLLEDGTQFILLEPAEFEIDSKLDTDHIDIAIRLERATVDILSKAQLEMLALRAEKLGEDELAKTLHGMIEEAPEVAVIEDAALDTPAQDSASGSTPNTPSGNAGGSNSGNTGGTSNGGSAGGSTTPKKVWVPAETGQRWIDTSYWVDEPIYEYHDFCYCGLDLADIPNYALHAAQNGCAGYTTGHLVQVGTQPRYIEQGYWETYTIREGYWK